jgi:hypothetical protein
MANIYQEVIDGTNQITTRTYKNGLTITEDGAGDQVTITTTGGASVIVQSNSITIKEAGNGSVKLAAGKVALGVVGGDEILALLEDLCEALSLAQGNLGYLLSNSTEYTTIKNKITAIKASL